MKLKKFETLIQCKLLKIDGPYRQTLVTYVPQRFAIKGTKVWVEISGKKEFGWEIVNVYTDSAIETPRKINKEVRRHKKNTGDIK